MHGFLKDFSKIRQERQPKKRCKICVFDSQKKYLHGPVFSYDNQLDYFMKITTKNYAYKQKLKDMKRIECFKYIDMKFKYGHFA